jgi:hypothetical protein
MRSQRSLWPVEMRMVIYGGDVDAQASVLADALARDDRTRGNVHWRHAPPGWRWAEDGAVVLNCFVLATDAADADLVGNALMDDVVEREVCSDPPAVLVPVLAGLEVVGTGTGRLH